MLIYKRGKPQKMTKQDNTKLKIKSVSRNKSILNLTLKELLTHQDQYVYKLSMSLWRKLNKTTNLDLLKINIETNTLKRNE